MKQVFRADMNITFKDGLIELTPNKEYRFASTNGISGVVVFTSIRSLNSKSQRVTVRVYTERKRMFPGLDEYLNLISTSTGILLDEMVNVRNVDMRTLDNLKLVKVVGDKSVMEDPDGEYYLINSASKYQPVMNNFENIEEAELELLRSA